MLLERHDIRFPLWRKKVDSTLVRLGYTPVPLWVARMWSVPDLFEGVTGRRDPGAAVAVHFRGELFGGQIVPYKGGKAYRLFLDASLTARLSQTFLMSYMRDLEDRLRRHAGKAEKAEADIPFWEFLDLEFDALERQFIFTAHFVQTPTFPSLFQRLVGSPPLQRMENELADKPMLRIEKRGWKSRESYPFELGAHNVIYMLADVNRAQLYIGEAEDLISRFNRGHAGITDWTHYRYDLLPEELAPHRVALERMLICDIDSLLGARSHELRSQPGTFTFTNLKIDR